MKYPLDELNKNEIRGNQIRMKLKINGNDIKKGLKKQFRGDDINE